MIHSESEPMVVMLLEISAVTYDFLSVVILNEFIIFCMVGK